LAELVPHNHACSCSIQAQTGSIVSKLSISIPSIGAGFQPFLAEDPHQYWGIAFDAFFSCRRFGATDWMPQCRPTGLTR
jgi:hypothetical protein